jgi:hypothetical protein
MVLAISTARRGRSVHLPLISTRRTLRSLPLADPMRGASGSTTGSSWATEKDGGRFVTRQTHLHETEIVIAFEEVQSRGVTTFEWSGSDLWSVTPVEDLQYSYRVDEEEWSAYGGHTSRIYQSIPTGAHTFEVKARDRSGLLYDRSDSADKERRSSIAPDYRANSRGSVG